VELASFGFAQKKMFFVTSPYWGAIGKCYINGLFLSTRQFEQLAVNVLEECYQINASKAYLLVKKNNKSWADMNCLKMAAEAKNRVCSGLAFRKIYFYWCGLIDYFKLSTLRIFHSMPL
jgi:hypothetical protein